MENANKKLIKAAIKKLEGLDEVLRNCQETISSAIAEKETARYLLWLGFEKEENNAVR